MQHGQPATPHARNNSATSHLHSVHGDQISQKFAANSAGNQTAALEPKHKQQPTPPTRCGSLTNSPPKRHSTTITNRFATNKSSSTLAITKSSSTLEPQYKQRPAHRGQSTHMPLVRPFAINKKCATHTPHNKDHLTLAPKVHLTLAPKDHLTLAITTPSYSLAECSNSAAPLAINNSCGRRHAQIFAQPSSSSNLFKEQLVTAPCHNFGPRYTDVFHVTVFCDDILTLSGTKDGLIKVFTNNKSHCIHTGI